MSPSRIGALYALALVFSIFFDIIYMRALGISIAVAPISITDHVLSATIWIPLVLIAAIAAPATSSSWSFLYDVSWVRNDASGMSAASWRVTPCRNIWIICKMLCKVLIAIALFFVSVIATPWATWWWLWNIATPYDPTFLVEMAGRLMIALILIISLLVIVIDTLSSSPVSLHEQIMNPNRSRFLSILSFAMSIFFLVFTTVTLAYFSESQEDCSQIRDSSLIIDNNRAKYNMDPQFVLFRSFEKHFLVFNCVESRMEFLRADEVDGIIAREQTGPHPTASTLPVASWLLQLGAEQR